VENEIVSRPYRIKPPFLKGRTLFSAYPLGGGKKPQSSGVILLKKKRETEHAVGEEEETVSSKTLSGGTSAHRKNSGKEKECLGESSVPATENNARDAPGRNSLGGDSKRRCGLPVLRGNCSPRSEQGKGLRGHSAVVGEGMCLVKKKKNLGSSPFLKLLVRSPIREKKPGCGAV